MGEDVAFVDAGFRAHHRFEIVIGFVFVSRVGYHMASLGTGTLGPFLLPFLVTTELSFPSHRFPPENLQLPWQTRVQAAGTKP